MPPEPRGAWWVVAAAFCSLALIFGVSYSFAAFFTDFSSEFQVPRADVSWVFGLCGLVYFVLGVGGGLMADRWGPRRVGGTGMVLIAGGLWLTSSAQSLGTIYLSYGAMVGLGIALVYTPAIACVPPWFVARRGLAAGLASAGIGAGTLVGPLCVAAAIEAWGWRGALQAMAVAVLVLGLVVTSRLRQSPLARAGTQGQAAGLTLAQAWRKPSFVWLYLGTLLGGPAMFIPFAHVSAAARDLGVDAAHAVGLVGIIGLGSLVGRFAIGWLADRLGRAQTLVLMQLSMGASYLVWGAAGGQGLLVVFALWFGLSYGSIVSLLPAICMDYFGGKSVASVVGALYSGAAFGNLLGPVLAGAVFDGSGHYLGVMAVCGVLSLSATWASRQMQRSGQARY
jgi:MFS family permease